jgi:hypothetical protein
MQKSNPKNSNDIPEIELNEEFVPLTVRQRVQAIMQEKKKFHTQKEGLEFDVFMRRY